MGWSVEETSTDFRLFCIRSLSNAACATHRFDVPPNPVALNAEFGFDADVGRGMRGQGCILVEALDENGRVVPGFEREHCVMHELDTDARRIETRMNGGALLVWQDRPLSLLAGRTVALRFYVRDARIYDGW